HLRRGRGGDRRRLSRFPTKARVLLPTLDDAPRSPRGPPRPTEEEMTDATLLTDLEMVRVLSYSLCNRAIVEEGIFGHLSRRAVHPPACAVHRHRRGWSPPRLPLPASRCRDPRRRRAVGPRRGQGRPSVPDRDPRSVWHRRLHDHGSLDVEYRLDRRVDR